MLLSNRNIFSIIKQMRILILWKQRDKRGKIVLNHIQDIQGRHPLVKGTLYQRRRQSVGQKHYCKKGRLKGSKGFSYSEEGRTKHTAISKVSDKEYFKRCVEEYRWFRKARAELFKDCQSLMSLVDKIELARRISLQQFLNNN